MRVSSVQFGRNLTPFCIHFLSLPFLGFCHISPMSAIFLVQYSTMHSVCFPISDPTPTLSNLSWFMVPGPQWISAAGAETQGLWTGPSCQHRPPPQFHCYVSAMKLYQGSDNVSDRVRSHVRCLLLDSLSSNH